MAAQIKNSEGKLGWVKLELTDGSIFLIRRDVYFAARALLESKGTVYGPGLRELKYFFQDALEELLDATNFKWKDHGGR
jgi:hypothetical protein